MANEHKALFLENPKSAIFEKKSKNDFLTFFSGVVGSIHNPCAILRSLLKFQPDRVKIGRLGFFTSVGPKMSCRWVRPKNSKKI